ncbi:MAG: ribosome biogenesis GTPase YlqF [Candidatus Flemingibacterium sp.]|nr:ribosome biogenesis GTPase YlqF [Candidatus Flemingibacterium sp.]
MPSSVIQWFPGHMAKTKRLITECLPLVDIVIEVLDARIPVSSKNPVLDSLLGQKPRLAVFSKSALADPEASRLWQAYYREKGTETIFYDCRSGDNLNAIAPKVREILGEKLERYESKGMTGRKLKAMIVGIPNVGKSSLINALAGSNRAKVENRPGVTLTKQWITTKVGIDLLDMPGVLWPKFEDRIVGENLAITGAIKDDVLDIEQLAVLLVGRLRKIAPDKLSERYKLGDMAQYDDIPDHELFEIIGRKRGFLVSGGEVDWERSANMLLDEFRAARIGRITLEVPAAD